LLFLGDDKNGFSSNLMIEDCGCLRGEFKAEIEDWGTRELILGWVPFLTGEEVKSIICGRSNSSVGCSIISIKIGFKVLF